MPEPGKKDKKSKRQKEHDPGRHGEGEAKGNGEAAQREGSGLDFDGVEGVQQPGAAHGNQESSTRSDPDFQQSEQKQKEKDSKDSDAREAAREDQAQSQGPSTDADLRGSGGILKKRSQTAGAGGGEERGMHPESQSSSPRPNQEQQSERAAQHQSKQGQSQTHHHVQDVSAAHESNKSVGPADFNSGPPAQSIDEVTDLQGDARERVERSLLVLEAWEGAATSSGAAECARAAEQLDAAQRRVLRLLGGACVGAGAAA